MIYVALIYLIIVTIYALMACTQEFKNAVITGMKKSSPDTFEIIDAEKFYNKVYILIILFSPILLLTSLIETMFRTINK